MPVFSKVIILKIPLEYDYYEMHIEGFRRHSFPMRFSFFQRLLLCLPWLGLVSGMAWGLESEALPQHLRFTHLTQADGMVPGGIVAMLQDHQGYIWIATEEGLSRYDGYEVRNFRHDPASPYSLAENSLVALAFLPPRGTGSGFSQGMVWAATARGFLEQIDTLTGDIRHVSLTTNGKPIQLNRINFLFADSQRRLWIGHRKGICRVNPDTLECREFDIGADDGGMAAWQASKPHSEGSPDAANHPVEDPPLWMVTHDGVVLRYDPELDVLSQVWDAKEPVQAVCGDAEGRLWLATQLRGLIRITFDGKMPTRIEDDYQNSMGIGEVTSIFRDSLDRLWFASTMGLIRFDPAKATIFRVAHDPLEPRSLLSNQVTCIFEDRKNVLWVGFASGGVSRCNHGKSWFPQLPVVSLGAHGLSHRSISALEEDRQGKVWIATANGLDRWDPETGVITNQIFKGMSVSAALPPIITVLREDSKGRLWLGTRGGGLIRLDNCEEDSRTARVYEHDPGKGGSLANNHISDIAEDKDGRIWIGTLGGGVSIYQEGQDTFQNIHGDGPEGLADDFINDLLVDHEGVMLVSCGDKGIMRYRADSGTFEPHPRFASGEVDLLYEGRDQQLWIASSGIGLSRLDPVTGAVLTLSQRNSRLPLSEVRGLVEDESGDLWISTQNGVAQLNQKTMDSRVFDEDDGLQSKQFHPHCAIRLRNGRVLLAGPNGLNVIDPKILPEAHVSERPVLTGLELFGAPVFPSKDGPLLKPLSLTDVLTLPYDKEGRISLRFATLDYATPHHNFFRYRLLPEDKDWQMADDFRRATYSALQPGKYTFTVQSSADGTTWNADTAKINIQIRPRWYALWYVRVGFGLSLAGLLGYFLLLRFRSREEKLRRSQEQLEVKFSKAEAELARQLQHAMLLEQTGLVLGGHDGSGNLLETALRHLGEAFGVSRCYVRAGGPGKDGSFEPSGFQLVAQHVDQGQADAEDPLPCESPSLFQEIVSSDRALAVPDVALRKDLFPESEKLGDCGVVALLAMRTSYLGLTNGYIVLHHADGPREWRADEIKLLESLAGQLGLVLAQMEQQSREESQRRELEKAKKEADIANSSKSEFLAKMTHELRTPLNAIIGFSELLCDDSELTPRQRETLDIINHSGEHLLGVINDILEVSKIEAGKVELVTERFNLGNLLTSIHEMLAFGIRSKGLSFEVNRYGDLPGEILADKAKLRQIIINLISNATKFTEHGRITLSVQAGAPQAPLGGGASEQERLIFFEVRDTGPGIPKEQIPKLFENFSQTDTGQRSRMGTGLGLAICKAFAELMGGRVEVESLVGVGSAFRFFIRCTEMLAPPEIRVEVHHERPSAPKVTGQTKRLVPGHPEIRVLIAEDQPANRLLASRILSAAGFKLAEAENGAEAVKECRVFKPHLVLMDEEMPIMRGREAIKAIRADASLLQPVIISLTAFALDDTKAAAIEAGSDDFLTKPFRIDALLNILAKHLPLTFEGDEAELGSVAVS